MKRNRWNVLSVTSCCTMCGKANVNLINHVIFFVNGLNSCTFVKRRRRKDKKNTHTHTPSCDAKHSVESHFTVYAINEICNDTIARGFTLAHKTDPFGFINEKKFTRCVLSPLTHIFIWKFLFSMNFCASPKSTLTATFLLRTQSKFNVFMHKTFKVKMSHV